MKDDKTYLNHILDEISNIEDFLDGMDKSDFMDDVKTQNAVIRSFEVIGEAVGNLSDDIKDKNPDSPWQDIKDMRNKLIHEYFGVDLDLVWSVSKKDLAKLKNIVKDLI